MTFVPELQADLHLCSVSLAPKRGLEVVVRNVVENKKPSPVGRHHTDVMSYPTIFTPSQTFRISLRPTLPFPSGPRSTFFQMNTISSRDEVSDDSPVLGSWTILKRTPMVAMSDLVSDITTESTV